MEIIFDTNGGIRDWMWKHPEVGEADYKACIGWKDTNMCAAVGFEIKDQDCYLHLVVKKNEWWNRKNLTFIANVCYDYFRCNNIISLSSKENEKMHSILDRLGFHRREINLDGRQLVKYNLPLKEINDQRWYRGK